MKAPFFSICIPVYQGEAFIKKAINSVINQTFQDWELIITDNASTDRTWEIIQNAASQDPRISIFRNSSNIGMARNLNECLSHATGEWIGILAADDIYHPEALERIFAAVKDSQVALWMHAHDAVHSEERKDLVSPYPVKIRMSMKKLSEIFYLRGNIFGEISCYFVSRKATLKCPEGFHGNQSTNDVDYWMRIALANLDSEAIYSPEVLTETLIHENSGSTYYINTGENISDIFIFIEKYSFHKWPFIVKLKQACRTIYFYLRYKKNFSSINRNLVKKNINIIFRNMFSTHKKQQVAKR